MTLGVTVDEMANQGRQPSVQEDRVVTRPCYLERIRHRSVTVPPALQPFHG